MCVSCLCTFFSNAFSSGEVLKGPNWKDGGIGIAYPSSLDKRPASLEAGRVCEPGAPGRVWGAWAYADSSGE